MNLYKKLLDEKEQKKKLKKQELYNKYKDKRKEYYNKNKDKIISNSKKYYYENRDYILERQRIRKFQNKEYYKEWYEKNKNEVQERRRQKNGGTIKNTKGIHYYKPKPNKEPIKKKVYKPEDFILFKI